MSRVPVFYSFHYDLDVFRVQQVRNIGVVDGNASASPNEWEQVQRNGDAAVRRWIDENMKYRRCVIVLVGAQTAFRPWVQYEIAKAWDEGRGLFGIYIDQLKDVRTRSGCARGLNPFTFFNVKGRSLATLVPCYDPGYNAYTAIAQNLDIWVSTALQAAETGRRA